MAIFLPDKIRISCFGYVDGRFYGGTAHHMAIMNFLLAHGYDWDMLMNAKQAWGWILSDVAVGIKGQKEVSYRLSTDAAAIDPTLAPSIEEALYAITGLPARLTTVTAPTNGTDYAPNYQKKYEDTSGYYSYKPLPGVYIYDSATHEQGWVPQGSTQSYAPPEDPPANAHPVPGGGMPPPKVSMWKEARTKFVYDAQTGKLLASDDWKIHHPDLLEQMGMDDLYIDRLLTGGGMNDVPRYLFGEHVTGESPEIWNDNAKIPPEYLDAAHKAYKQYLNQRQSSSREGRYAWLIDYKHQIKFGQLDEHHVDIGWGGGEAATGDVLVDRDWEGKPVPGQITLRVITFDWEYDLNEVMDRVASEWDRLHPDLEITKYENLAEHPQEWYEPDEDQGLTNYGSYDIISYYDEDDDWIDDDEGPNLNHKFNSIDPVTDPDGHQWKVYQMESGEYKNHHAIMVDNNNKRLFLNYHGHHGPMLEAGVNAGLGQNAFYDTVQGHYRLEPSDHEPFAEGWGFHFGSLTPWQESIFENSLKSYHGVDDLQKAWVGHKEATVKWVGPVKGHKKWSALYDRENAVLYIWPLFDDQKVAAKYLNSIIPGTPFFKNGSVKNAGKYTQAEGNYTTISYILPTGAKDIEKEKAMVSSLLETALIQKWPTGEKETHFQPINQRFMVKKDGSVIMGDYRSHYDLIADYITPEIAEKYANFQVDTSEYPFIAGGFFSDCGIIRLVHTAGEPEYDPQKVAGFVAEAARQSGESVNRLVVYEDLRTPAKMKTCFNLEGGSA